MIQPIQIKLMSQSDSERIEIASGPFLGHEVGVLRALPCADGHVRFQVNGALYLSFSAALNACMSAAYAYVAQQEEGEALDAACRA
jgi:hypothetical protein